MSLATIEDLNISQTLPVISCDYESLKLWAVAFVERYKDLLVTEDQVKDIKRDMAEINKVKHNLERARIDAVKAVSAPIREFEAQIKEVCAIFDEAYGKLGNQVRKFEEIAREEKRDKIQQMIDEQVAVAIAQNLEIRDNISVSINEKWLNKTFSLKDVYTEIERLIKEQIQVEQEKIRIEKAKSERRLFIENAVKAANEKYGLDLPISVFMQSLFTDLDQDAEDVLENIKKEFELQVEIIERKRNEEKLEQQKTEQNVSEFPKGIFPKAPERAFYIPQEIPTETLVPMKMIQISVIFPADKEQEVKEVLNQNQAMKIVRQLQGMGYESSIKKVDL